MSGPRQEAADTYRNVDMTTLTFRFVTTSHFLISVTLSSVSLISAVVCLRKDIHLHEFLKIYKKIFSKNCISGLAFKVTDTKHISHTLHLHTWLQ